MKKVLALILTAAMLLSCMIVGISAVREHATVVGEGTSFKAAVSEANFAGESGYTTWLRDRGLSTYTLKMVLKSSVADFGNTPELVAYLAGSPSLHFANGKVGMNGVGELDYTFADDTWYTIEWIVDGDTTIVINGETVGTLSGAKNACVYGTLYRAYLDEIAVYDADGNWYWGDDMEDGGDDVFASAVTTFEIPGETTYVNNNVTYKTFKAAMNSADFCGESDYAKQLSNSGLSTYTLKMVLKSCAADFGNTTEMVAYLAGTPSLNFASGKVGMNGVGEIDYTFADDTWYTIEYVVNGDTTIKINGEVIGTLSGAKNACVYGTLYRAYLDEIAVYDADGDWFWGDDMEDGTDSVFAATGVSEFTAKNNEYDLGMKYYYWDYDTVAYHENLNTKNIQTYSLDYCIDQAGGGFINAFYGGSVILTDTKVEISGASVALDTKLNTWYHLELVDAGDEIEVYLDDAYVGSIAASAIAPDGICGHASHIAIDNLTIDGKCEDFEDGAYNAWSTGTAGFCLDYDFEAVTEKTIFDEIGATTTPEGGAYLIENGWDSTSGGYVEFGGFGNLGSNYIIDFDLALLPTNNHADGNFFEIWTNWNSGAPIRWKVGTEFAGKDSDLVQIDWGEATKDNFHRVTMQFKNNRGYIYVDNTLVYDGLCGSYADLSLMIVMNWNANAIIDNFRVIDGESYELKKDQTDLPTGSGYNLGNNVCKVIDLDAADFCADNGCMTGFSSMEYDSTCYSLGNYQTFCAVCGELKDNHDIALKNHIWAGYSFSNMTDTGLVFTYCKNSGCVEKRYTSLPSNYNGTLYQFFDMQDDFVLVFGDDEPASASGLDGYNADGEQCWKIVDGKLEFLGHAVYDEYWGIENAKMPVNDWSISYDFFLDESKHWTNEDGGVDSECFFIRCCGSAGYQLQVGWDRNTEELFIRRTDGSKVLASTSYSFENLTTYNFKVACKYEGYGYTHENPDFDAPWYAEISIWVNGEKVLAYGDLDGTDEYSIYEIAYGADLGAYHKFPTFGQFGTSYTIDNLAFGSYDFEIVPLAGDIDGDGELSAADATMMRQYLAGIITLEDFVDASLADVNGDGEVNAKDQLALRIALAA